MRADDPSDEKTDLDENRRTVGVIGLLAGDKIGEAHYFRLPREYDRTGMFRLGQDVDLGQHPNTPPTARERATGALMSDPLDVMRALVVQRAIQCTTNPKYRGQAERLRNRLLRGLSRQQRAAWKFTAAVISGGRDPDLPHWLKLE
jgi:hypothetical protein